MERCRGQDTLACLKLHFVSWHSRQGQKEIHQMSHKSVRVCVCVRVCVWEKEVWLLVCFVRYFKHLLGVFCRVFASLAVLIAADIFYAELCVAHATPLLPPAPSCRTWWCIAFVFAASFGLGYKCSFWL